MTNVFLALVLAGVALAPAVAVASPEAVAREFLEAVRAGDVARAGVVINHQFYRPDGRPPFLFSYEAAREPCLAFMVGRPFDIGTPSDLVISHGEAFFSSTRIASFRIAVTFDPARYSPLVLPDPLAFGRAMPFIELIRFAKQPDRQRLPHLTLQVRPTVAAGLIPPPPSQRSTIPPSPAPPGARTASIAHPPMHGLAFDAPRDAGQVLLPSGEALTREQLELLLPRVRTIVFKLYLKRSRPRAAWKELAIWPVEVVVVSEGVEYRFQFQA